MEIVRDAFRTEERGIDVRSGIAGAIAVSGPLAIGLAIDELIPAVVAAIGGLNAALSVPRADVQARVWWGSLSVVGGAGALVLADASSGSDATLVLVTLAWVAGWALSRAAGPTGALLGFGASAMLVIYAGLPLTGPLAERILWYALGAITGAGLMIVARAGGRGSMPAWPDVAAALRGPALRWHAARLSIAVSAGTALYLLVGLAHGYWVPLTILAVLQPGIRATHVRSLQRAAGTLLAGVLVLGITALTDEAWPIAACAGVCAFFLYALRERGYFWLVVLVTPTALLMLSAVRFQGESVAVDRITDSMVGIVIGLAFAELARLGTMVGSQLRSRRGLP